MTVRTLSVQDAKDTTPMEVGPWRHSASSRPPVVVRRHPANTTHPRLDTHTGSSGHS